MAEKPHNSRVDFYSALIVAMGAYFMAFYILLTASPSPADLMHARSWKAAPCKVLSRNVERQWNARASRTVVTKGYSYSYTWEGKEYTGMHRFREGREWSMTEGTCYVNPSKPAQSMSALPGWGPDLMNTAITAGMAILIGTGALIMALRVPRAGAAALSRAARRRQ